MSFRASEHRISIHTFVREGTRIIHVTRAVSLDFNPHLRTRRDLLWLLPTGYLIQFQSSPSYEKGHAEVDPHSIGGVISILTFVREGTSCGNYRLL